MTDRKLAHYEIQELIGRGGMGEVFRARDAKLGREVALKMLPERLADDDERLARSRREAQVLAALNHPGIAAIYGLESEGDRHALVMELVPGPDLADRLRQGPLGVREGLEVALQLAEAIEAAHEKGIVHRDLKPANIKITAEGRVKVLDFGLAKALADAPSGSVHDSALSPTLTSSLTGGGNVIQGTAAYMSPEQARGGEIDTRTDIWAFGVVLAEILGGRKLFQGETVSDTLASVLKSAIDLDELPDDLPPAARRLIRRCLQRDPKQRLRDIGDARLVLQDALRGEADDPAAPPPQQRNPWPLRAAVAVAAVAVVAAVLFRLTAPEPTELPLRKFDIPLDRQDASANAAFSPEISPDGGDVLYLSDERIWVRDLATTVSRPLPGTEGARAPFWSPDGEWIAFGTSQALMKIDRSGGHSMILAKLVGSQVMGSASSGCWNPDGTICYTTGSSGVLRASAQAGEVTLHHQQRDGEVDFHEICRLPDGRGWVFVVHDMDDYGNLTLLTPEGERKSLLDLPDDALNNPVWSPSGHLLFERQAVAEGIWAVPFSLDGMAVSGDPFLVAEGGRKPSVSADGTLVYAAGVTPGELELVWYDREGRELDVVARCRTTRPFPSISPDGTKILLAASADDARELWVFDTANGTERRLTFDGELWGIPVWHPDGRRLAAYTEPDYVAHLITLDGSEPRRELGPGILLGFSSDGGQLYYSRPNLQSGFNFNVFTRPLDAPFDEGRELVASDAIEWAPQPSPDGRYLLYVSNESGHDEVYATTLPDLKGRWQVSRGGGSWAKWRSDGGEIYYTSRDAIHAVAVDDADGFALGRPRKLFDRPSTDWSASWYDGYDVTPDGERFVMLRPAVDESDEQPALVVVQNWFAEFSGN